MGYPGGEPPGGVGGIVWAMTQLDAQHGQRHQAGAADDLDAEGFRGLRGERETGDGDDEQQQGQGFGGAGGQFGEGEDLLQVDRDGHEEQAGEGRGRSYLSDEEVLPRSGGVRVHRAGWPAGTGGGGSGGPTTVVA